MKNERYTPEQKRLLKIDPKTYTEEEREAMRIVLLPRKRYLPQSDEDGMEIVSLALGKAEKVALFCRCREEILSRYPCEGRWSAGDKSAVLYYRFSLKGKPLCALRIRIDHFELMFSFGKKEMDLFEKVRHTFPRESIQYGYDASGLNAKRKILAYPMDRSYEDVFRVLALRFPLPDKK